ncbi:MAG: selenium metabolism-associated LysR family transcriptional regulator [bacterium]
MNLDQLKTFIKVAKLNSFSLAAQEVNLSQPTVSCQINNLEEELGVRLFDRLGKKILMTTAGRTLLQYAKNIVILEDEARLAIDDLLNIKKGTIKLGCSTIPGAYILPPLIQKFTAKNPNIKIISEINDTQTVTEKVIDATFNLGIVGGKLNCAELLYHDLIQDTLVVAMSSQHRLANRSSITFEELKTEPFVIREEGSGTRKGIEENLAKKGFGVDDLNIIAQLGSTEAIKQAIKANLGLSILSKCAINDEVEFGLLRHPSVEGINFIRNFYLILPRLRSSLPVVEAFKDFLLRDKG